MQTFPGSLPHPTVNEWVFHKRWPKGERSYWEELLCVQCFCVSECKGEGEAGGVDSQSILLWLRRKEREGKVTYVGNVFPVNRFALSMRNLGLTLLLGMEMRCEKMVWGVWLRKSDSEWNCIFLGDPCFPSPAGSSLPFQFGRTGKGRTEAMWLYSKLGRMTIHSISNARISRDGIRM